MPLAVLSVALYARAWVEIKRIANLSPHLYPVALYARAWVEILTPVDVPHPPFVALYARAWVEIFICARFDLCPNVALYARAWVEIIAHPDDNDAPRQSPSTRGRG